GALPSQFTKSDGGSAAGISGTVEGAESRPEDSDSRMPKIVEEQSFDGAEALIDRLGLDELLAEVRAVITSFELLIEERKDANGTAGLRAIIDNRFRAAGGWTQKKTGGVDWIKRQAI